MPYHAGITNDLFLINTMADHYPPPNITNKECEVSSGKLLFCTFSWIPVAPDCPAIHYNIIVSNCGSCPTDTNHTTVTCYGTDVQVDVDICIFAVQTVVCGNNAGDFSVIYILLNDNPNNHDYEIVGWSVSILTGTIVSATILGGVFGACVAIFTVITIQKIKRKIQATKQASPNHLYTEVGLKLSVIDTKDNIAYGNVIK